MVPFRAIPWAANRTNTPRMDLGAMNASTTRMPWSGLSILSVAIFFCITSEVLPTGLMPEIASELGVSESQVGLLITVFAGAVVLTAAPLATLTHRYSRKSLVIAVLVVFAAANIFAALAPTYGILVIARVLGGVAHGLFWAVVGAYAAHLVEPAKLGKAVALTNAGGTAAFVMGVPLATALGHAFGWRFAFAAIAVIVLVLIGLVIWLLPPVDHHVPVRTGEIPLPARKDPTIVAVVVVCITVVLVMFAQNVFYTYIAPFLIQLGNVQEGAVAGYLFLYGGAAAVGLALSGFVADRMPKYGFVLFLGVVAVGVLILGLAPGNPVLLIVGIAVWSVGFGGMPSLMQTRMLRAASPRIRDIASAYLTTAFNIAIGAGAAVGGLLLDAAGVGVLPFTELGIVLVAIVFALTTDKWLRSRAERPVLR